jgi:uncharacterized protein (TIGR00369 family)
LDRESFDSQPLHRALGIRLLESRAGFARVSLRISAVTSGGVGGSIHGGVLAALVDVAMLAALSPAFEADDEPAGTADLSITYLRPALGETVVAEATLLKKGRQLAVVEVSILDGEGRLCAKGRTLYALRRGLGATPGR